MPRTIANACSTLPRVPGSARPTRCNKRLCATALTPRQTATLVRSMPSWGETSGRSRDGARELDSGTTTTNSSSPPAKISSTEITIAGLFLPGSPLRAAPNETSQISPRRGSVDAIAEGRLPLAILSPYRGNPRIFSRSVPLRPENRLAGNVASQVSNHCRQRDASLARLLGKEVTRLTGNPDRCGLSGHRHIVAPRSSD